MSTLPDSLQGEGERVELLKLFARSDIGLISIPAGPPPSCKTQLGIKISNMGDIQLTHSSHKEVFFTPEHGRCGAKPSRAQFRNFSPQDSKRFYLQLESVRETPPGEQQAGGWRV